MRVTLVGVTQFTPPPDVPWSTDAEGGEALAEFAGRACYQSWGKPNPQTATNAGYLRHILEVGHGSVLEHGTVSFYITGVSRSLTHELVRHRHLSFSQQSQRYVDESDAAVVVPEAVSADIGTWGWFDRATEVARQSYTEIVKILTEAGKSRKQARQAARAVLPNATETRVVVTGNYRAWRHFIAVRATRHADPEICALAVEVLRQCQVVAPNVFGDFVISKATDGSEVAASDFTGRGGE